MQSNIYARVAPLLKEIPLNCEPKQLEKFLNLHRVYSTMTYFAFEGIVAPAQTKLIF